MPNQPIQPNDAETIKKAFDELCASRGDIIQILHGKGIGEGRAGVLVDAMIDGLMARITTVARNKHIYSDEISETAPDVGDQFALYVETYKEEFLRAIR